MTTVDTSEAVDGYAVAAPLWMAAGWSPLPLTRGKKDAPPTGYTGNEGAYPDDDTVARWAAENPMGNLALRMPPGVVGIDIDEYKGEHAVDGVVALEAQLGVLPRTWASSSDRGDGSGIWLYRLPRLMRLRDKPIAGVEIIQRHHRYVVTWPSIHPEGRRYKVWDIDGVQAERLPTPGELTELPAAWVDYLAEPEPKPPPPKHDWDHVRLNGSGESWFDAVVEAYNAATTWAEILEPKGWRLRRTCGGIEYWTRPGKELRDGHSATIGATPSRDRLVVHSTDTPFDCSPTSYDRFSAYVVLEHHGARTEAARTLRASGYGPPEPPRINGKTPHSTPAPPSTVMLPDEFWAARVLLAHIRQMAHARNRSADAVLHSTLARMAAMVPYTVELPAVVGAPGSLNYFAAIVGSSGVGKSTAVNIGRTLLPASIVSRLVDKPLGSGEGLVELYMGTVDGPPDEEGKVKKIRGQEFHQAYVYIPEGDALSAQAERKGTTILPTMREIWSGETLGQSNATQDRTRFVAAGMYRMGLVAGFQPERAGRLLADEIGGTPQRFVFAMATDPAIPDKAPTPPGPLPWTPPDAGVLHRYRGDDEGWVRHTMAIEAGIAAEIRARDLAKARGLATTGTLDSHADLHRLKLAGLLALLDARMEIRRDDWDLAGIAWDTSRAVRAWVIEAVTAELEREETARINRHVRREITVDLARTEVPAKVETLSRRLAKWLHDNPPGDEGCPKRALTNRLAGPERAMLDAALLYAETEGWMVVIDDRYQPGTARPV